MARPPKETVVSKRDREELEGWLRAGNTPKKLAERAQILLGFADGETSTEIAERLGLMEEVSLIGIDLAKRSFQVHGARADGSVAYRRKLSRGKLLSFLASQPPCTVAMEACAGAHYWGRQIVALGHEVRLVPPIYVKPFVKRSKNDAADAEAITETAQRPTMHFVAVKTEAQQAQGMLFRTRDLLVRQRTQTINALRGHLAEYGVVAPQGRAVISRPVTTAGIPAIRPPFSRYRDTVTSGAAQRQEWQIVQP